MPSMVGKVDFTVALNTMKQALQEMRIVEYRK